MIYSSLVYVLYCIFIIFQLKLDVKSLTSWEGGVRYLITSMIININMYDNSLVYVDV